MKEFKLFTRFDKKSYRIKIIHVQHVIILFNIYKRKNTLNAIFFH